MVKILSGFLLFFLAGISMAESANYMNAGWRANGNCGNMEGKRAVSWRQLAPAGKDKLIILSLPLAGGVDAERHQAFNARMKIFSASGKPVKVKLEASSLSSTGKSGYLYGMPVNVKTGGEWRDYELGLHQTEEYGVRKEFSPSHLTELKIVIICNSFEEQFDIVLEQAGLGKSRKESMDNLKKQLNRLNRQAVIPVTLTKHSPIIDGKPDDECWADAFCLTDFYSNNGDRAKEQTEVYLCRDSENLYLCMKAYAGVLDPVNNLLDEFKAVATKHDGATYEDDCIEIFFSGSPGKYGQVVANLNTTFERIVSPAGSDSSWNPAIKMKGRKFIGTTADGTGGFYVIEMSMPLNELKQFSDESGGLTLNIARQNRYLNELSNWIRSSSFHSMSEYARLIFTDNPGGRINRLEKNGRTFTLPYQWKRTPEKDELQVGIQFVYSPEHEELKLMRLYEQGAGMLTFLPEQENFLCSLVVADGKQIIYRTPLESFGEGLVVCRGRISVVSGSHVFVNGNPIPAGDEFGLVQGKNTIAVRTDAPESVHLQAGGHKLEGSDKAWRFSCQAAAGWNANSFDDGGWSFGTPPGGVPVYMRRTVIVNHSRLYPLLNETAPLSAAFGSVQPFSAIMNGLKDEELMNYRFYLELPDGVEWVGASGQNGKNYGRPRCSWKEVGRVMNEGKSHTRYEISFTGNSRKKEGVVNYIPPKQLQTEDLVAIAIRPREKSNDENLYCYYYMTANDGNYVELKRRFSIKVLPEFTGQSPRRMKVMTWLSFRTLDDIALLRMIYQEHANAGFNIANTDSGQAEIIKPTGMKYCSRFNFEPSGFAPVSVLAKYPGVRFKDHNGIEHRIRIPFYHIVHNKALRQELRRELSEYLTATRMDILDWDFEFDPFTGLYSSYDDDTLADFRTRYRIAETLTSGIIRKKYADEWVEYMNELTAGVFALIHEVTSRHGVLWDVYSGYPSEYTKRHYGIDYELVLPHVDFAMMGYGRPLAQIREILKLSRKYTKPVIFGICAKPYFLYQEAPQFKVLPALVMRRVVDGGFGVMYWGHYCSDGQLLHAFHEVNRLLYQHEGFILDGKRVDERLIERVQGVNGEEVAIYEYENKFLLIVLNQDAEDKEVVITFKQLPGKSGMEFYSGMLQATDGNRLRLKVNSGKIAAVLYKGD